ncbi:unnamed protein product [Allacma fusca]|uniref:SHSP domain-containing protein n=1 Tax=Allacma fusca TaxID=39272 RepID=A0A8J2P3Q0_9HEXA|nr:unnamed protein product [Allacma fusca]
MCTACTVPQKNVKKPPLERQFGSGILYKNVSISDLGSNWRKLLNVADSVSCDVQRGKMSFQDKIPMHYRESFFRDPFFADCWNILDKTSSMTEKHSEMSSTRSSSSHETHSESHEEHESHSPSPKPGLDGSSGMSKIINDPDKFQVMVEVESFSPEELTVKTVDHYVVVEGKHEEKKEPHGYISRQFTRKYLLPIDCKPENVRCNLSADGILVISVPRENIDLLPLKETIIEISKSDKKVKDGAKNPTAAA